MADAVLAAKVNRKTPDEYYNIKRMLKRVLTSNGHLLLCGTCTDARGIGDEEIISGARRSTKDELAGETLAADKVIVF